MTPAQLGCCIKGYELKRKMQDDNMWNWWGNYGISAMMFAIEHCFAKRPKTEYIKKPIMQMQADEGNNKKNNEALAVFEMKQRIKILEKEGGMLSPK